eukprot:scaffold3214_cov113-Cylindrotheca_fusiformis.AAC.1
MGCSSSKQQEKAVSKTPPAGGRKRPSGPREQARNGKPSDKLYKLLYKAMDSKTEEELASYYDKATAMLEEQRNSVASFRHASTKATPLHLSTKLMELDCSEQLLKIQELLCQFYPRALSMHDRAGNIPLHYAIAPSTASKNKIGWQGRGAMVSSLIQADPKTAQDYLTKNDVLFQTNSTTSATSGGVGCSPLYRVLETMEDDFSTASPSVAYVKIIHNGTANISTMPGIGNASDGDKPLGLLYRKFTRQFDISEKFFTGDNSRPEVVEHRQKYKTAAGNTWKIIEVLLRPYNNNSNNNEDEESWGIVHRAVQVETPPDLLRYIVETNAQDLTRVDAEGNVPLHYAAANRPPRHIPNTHFPVFYNKYVVDELLYKFPEGANMKDGQGKYPLTLAVEANKQWIGGGIKSLFDAFPDAIEQIDLDSHDTLRRALSLMTDHQLSDDDDDDDSGSNSSSSSEDEVYAKEEKQQDVAHKKKIDGIIKDNQHDAIMLVQQTDVDVSEVVTSMWAHEEDAGVQMLGCVAIYKMLYSCRDRPLEVLRIALSAVAAVVNAMKAHPNEMIVQETACKALRTLAPADGKREVSMVASGAVAAIVGAMQAHVGDETVQQEACAALAAIVRHGGADRATIVASVSGLTAILNALSAHSKEASVQKAGLQALVAMTDHATEANLPELPRSQTEPILINAKKAFPEDCGKAVDILSRRMSA